MKPFQLEKRFFNKMDSHSGFRCEIRSNGTSEIKFNHRNHKELHFTEYHPRNDSTLLFSENYADVFFVVESERIPAHKAIITSRCEYFAAMMYSVLPQEDQKEIKLNAPLKAFKLILGYIYTGELVTTNEEETVQVIGLSRAYLLTGLTKSIEKKLESNISLENVFNILKLAHSMKMISVFEKCCMFININLASVLRSDKWDGMILESWESLLELRFQNQQFTSGQQINSLVSEMEVFEGFLKWTKTYNQDIESPVIQNLFHKIRLRLIGQMFNVNPIDIWSQ